MNDRIKFLREKSITAENSVSPERAEIITSFFSAIDLRELSAPVIRALAFKEILAKKELYIEPLELITGERGPKPKATPTYPEINLHSVDDLEVLHDRKKVSFKSDSETRRIYAEKIIPYWKGKSNRDRIMNAMTPEWRDAFEAGVFTEFQEQRAPGHTVCGTKAFRMGMFDLIAEAKQTLSQLDPSVPGDIMRIEELKAMCIAADAIIMFANRHADKLEKTAALESDEKISSELKELASICRKVPANAPATFHQALQHYWFLHLGVITELNPWDSFNPGRLDQHLYPFYKKETEAGTLTKERATELLQSFWIKFNNHPSPPKVGVTAQESNTYTDFCLINTGGLKSDGSDAVNELSYLILDVIEEMRLLQPGSMVQISEKTPDAFIHRALKIIKTGFGQPSFFNSDAIVKELVNQGKQITDARNGGASGCVEAGAFGTEAYILTGYFNLPKILEITLNNGIDPVNGKRLGIVTGEPSGFSSYDELLQAFGRQLNYFADIKIKGNDTIHTIFATEMPAPFLSLLIEDCIKNGKDYNSGGARYNTSYIQGVGLGTITDCLTAIRYHVFDHKTFSFETLKRALADDFADYPELHHMLVYKTPKYGNDDDYADEQAKKVFGMFYDAVNGRETSIGGKYRINMLPTTSHVYFGSKINALPDGRKAGQPLSEGISPVQGADTHGPTAVLKSASKFDHTLTGGTLLNQKFTPVFFEGEESIVKLGALIRGYFSMMGHHIQFNVVSAETLRDAQKHPEKYRDLIVRVAGYSDYFNDLGEDLQDEIIRRTEQS